MSTWQVVGLIALGAYFLLPWDWLEPGKALTGGGGRRRHAGDDDEPSRIWGGGEERERPARRRAAKATEPGFAEGIWRWLDPEPRALAVRNPGRFAPPKGGRSPELAKAVKQSTEFHGQPLVVTVPEKQRKLPKHAIVVGDLEEVTYQPPAGSDRSHTAWRHRSGDKGILAKPSRKKPVLAVDPDTGRPLIVQGSSPMRFKPDKGLVG